METLSPALISSAHLRFSIGIHNFLTVPIYVYETIPAEGRPGERFEIQQSMAEPALTRHPESGQPVRRVLQAPNIATKYTPGATAAKLENRNLADKGFTKYEKDKVTGRYHRTAGKEGPSTIEPQR